MMQRRLSGDVVGFCAVGGLVFYLASALWGALFLPNVPMAKDWCAEWVDLDDGDGGQSTFSGCVEFKNDLEASKYFYNRALIERNKWWLFGTAIVGVVLAHLFIIYREKKSGSARHSSKLGAAIAYGILVAVVVPRIYSVVLPPPYRWFPTALTKLADERQRLAALTLGVPRSEVDKLVESQASE